MATNWELVLIGERFEFLRGVAEEAVAEIHRLEHQLSLFIPTSETADLNRSAATRPVVVDPRFFSLLKQSCQLNILTGGAFDITVAPLMKCWKMLGDTGAVPSPEEIASAMQIVGAQHMELDEQTSSVRFDREGVSIDLGAIGKGYAAQTVAELLVDYEIASGLLHGGTSTVYGIGAPPSQDAWQIAVKVPGLSDNTPGSMHRFMLNNRALSVSAPHGKCFEANGVRYGHVMDPRTGYPTDRCIMAAVAVDSATESDALSTALLTIGPEWLSELAVLRPGVQALVAWQSPEGVEIDTINCA